MQLTAIILLVFSLSLSARSVSQTVSFAGKDVPVRMVLDAIQEQTGYFVLANKQALDNIGMVTVAARNMELTEFLLLLLKDKPYEYEVDARTIFIRSKKQVTDLSHRLVVLPPPPITVRGRIIDENYEPVIASVLIKGTKRGTTTNADGFFELNNVADDAVLVVSASNIETREIKINGQASLNISVKIKIGEEESVTVSTGYWTTEKRKSVGNISKVSAKDIENQPVTSPLLALQGRVPGLEVSPTSGVPGSSVAIKIRGLNSLRLSGRETGVDGNIPLYVIDGVQIDPLPITPSTTTSIIKDGFDPLSTINPANIESIQILKDADATAIYGSRGANGVVLITTKNRISRGAVNIDVNAYKGVGEVVSRLDMLSTQEYLEMRREAIYNDGGDAVTYYEHPDFGPLVFPDLLLWDTTRYTNWQDKLLGGSSNISDVQLNIGAGSATTSISFGFGYHNETLIYPGDFGYKRYNGNVNLSHHSQDNRFAANLTATFGSNTHRIFDSNIWQGNSLTLSPVAPPLYTDDGGLNWVPSKFNYSTWSNPISWTRATHDAKGINLITNLNLTYRILAGLQASANIGYSVLDQTQVLKYPISSLDPYPITQQKFGKATNIGSNRTSWIIEPRLAYHRKINDHDFDIMVGTTFQDATSGSELFEGTGYTSDALLGAIQGAADITGRQNSSEYRYVGLYTRLTYNFQDKYLLSLTGRRDGSSRFGPGRQYGNFGSVGAGWIFSNTALLKNSSLLNFGKLRASYGTTGNDQISDGRYLPRYSSLAGNYNGTVTLNPVSLFNPDYAWEVTKKFEVGLEMALLSNRFTLEASWYRNRSSNQLVDYGLPLMTGFPSVNRNFPATIQNTGLEISLGVRIIDRRDVRWMISANASIPRNKLVKFDQIEQSPYASVFKVGEPLLIHWGYRWKGVNPATGLHDFEDINNDGSITSDDVEFTKSMGADYFGGIANTVTFKSFELSFLVQFSKRADRIGQFGLPGVASNQPKSVLKRWQKEGDVTDVQRFASGYSQEPSDAYNMWQDSDGVIKSITFARLKTFTLSYSFSAGALQKAKIKGAKLFIQGQNLLTFTSFEALDPETQNGAPPVRILSGGVQLKF